MNSDIKLCLLCHNMDFHEKWFLLSKFTGLLLEYTDKLIVLSDIVARSAVRYKAYNPNKLIKLFHPLYEVSEVKTDKQILCKQLDIKPLKTIMFFGYIKLYKGLDVFLKAIPLVHQDYRDVQFLVAGEIYRNDKIYKEIIRKYPDEINFVLHDKFIPNTDIDKYFSIADVIVVPYRSATQSGIVQLAYSYKKPVIVSNVEGLKDMVIDNQTGLVFEQNNHNLLAEKILEFLKSTNNFAKYIEEYNDKYSWKNFTDKLLQALKA